MIRPLNKNVLVAKTNIQPMRGIYMPQTNSNVFQVVSIGVNVSEVNVNDQIVIDITKAKEVTYNGDAYYLINEADILGIVEA